MPALAAQRAHSSQPAAAATHVWCLLKSGYHIGQTSALSDSNTDCAGSPPVGNATRVVADMSTCNLLPP